LYETIWFCWFFSVYISPVSVVGLKLFDCVEFSRYISAPCQLFVLNYLILLSSLCVYQPDVSCWFETIWLCWLFSVYINPVSAIGLKLFDCWVFPVRRYISPVSAVGLKLFDCVEFSQCISAPCQLLAWNYLTLLSDFSLCRSTPCQLLVWNYSTLLSKFPLCILAVCMKLLYTYWLGMRVIALLLSSRYQLFSEATPRTIVGTVGTINVLLPEYQIYKCFIILNNSAIQNSKL